MVKFCLPDKAFLDSHVGNYASAHRVVFPRQLCERGHPWPGRELLGDSDWVLSLSTPPQCPDQPGLGLVEMPLGSLDYVRAAVYPPAGAPGVICIWEQGVPAGEKRMHLDGALERKHTQVGC